MEQPRPGSGRDGPLLRCADRAAVASSYASFCVALAVLGGLGGLLDVGFNVQGIAVQRAYGRPILAGLHGVWSVALFAGGAVGAVAAAAGVSPTRQFVVVAAVLALASAPVLAWQLPEEDEPPVPAEVSHLPFEPGARTGRDRLRRLRRRGRRR